MATSTPVAAGLTVLPPDNGSSSGANGAAAKNAGKVAQDFEGMFLSQMLSAMWTTQDKGMFSAGPAGEIYRSMLTQEYGKAFARAGGIGIASALKSEILKLQEVPKS